MTTRNPAILHKREIEDRITLVQNNERFSSMELSIGGKRALLLASSGGLGKASALALSKEGVLVAVSSSSLERAQEAAAEIMAETGNLVVGLLGDLADPANMGTLVAEAQTALGGEIDILLLNHGGPAMQSAMEVSQDVMTEQVSMMVLSQVAVAQAVVPGMVERKWGRVFMVGASAISQPIPNNVLSNMFRNALAQYCKTLANEVVKSGVTVNVVSPMTVLTDRTRGMAAKNAAKKGVSPKEELAAREAALPSGRFGKPEEYGALIAFLASDLAGYSTGSNWRVDGGNVKAL